MCVLDTLPEGRKLSFVKKLSEAEVVVIVARPTTLKGLLSRLKRPAQLEERARPAQRPVKDCEVLTDNPLGEYNEARELLNEDGLPSRAWINHAEEELSTPKPLPQIGETKATWVSPPYTFTLARFKNLEAKTLFGGLDIDLPGEEYLAWHGPVRVLLLQPVGYIWFGGTNDPTMFQIGCYAQDYFMVYGAEGVHHAFRRVPTFDRPIPTLRFRDRANHILSLPASRWNIYKLETRENFINEESEESSSDDDGVPYNPPWDDVSRQTEDMDSKPEPFIMRKTGVGEDLEEVERQVRDLIDEKESLVQLLIARDGDITGIKEAFVAEKTKLKVEKTKLANQSKPGLQRRKNMETWPLRSFTSSRNGTPRETISSGQLADVIGQAIDRVDPLVKPSSELAVQDQTGDNMNPPTPFDIPEL
uniref:Uncharacterized protein n=1 Tax=Cannabis sativa TaxID=3483 RepID=A0A803Q810_CANSA